MARTFLLIGALSGVVGVVLGAFGAHGLRGRLSPDMFAVFETAVRYQMYHALAILLVGLMMAPMGGWAVHTAGWAFAIGIVLFSGSLYLLAITGTTAFGAITPIGGLAFLVGWGCLIIAGL